MTNEDPSKRAASGHADGANPVARSTPSPHEIVDLAAGANASAPRTPRSAKAKKGKPGRPSKLTPERLESLRADLLKPMSIEDAAERAGISESTFYEWKCRGKHALELRHKGQALSDEERDYADFVIMLEGVDVQLEAKRRTELTERRAELTKMLEAEAASHSKTETKIASKAVVYKGEVQRDDDGEIVMAPTMSKRTVTEKDVRAMTALLNNTQAQLDKLDETEFTTKSSDDTHGPTESTERRLAESIRVRREQLDEELRELAHQQIEALAAKGTMTPTTAAALSDVTDDDDGYYDLSIWESAYVVPVYDPEDSGNSGNPDVVRGI